jgi:hypothetical protein
VKIELRQQSQARVMCVGCFEFRPTLAFPDTEQPCLVCRARKQRQEAITDQLDIADREKLRRRQDAARQRNETMKRNGTRKAGSSVSNFRLKRRTVEDVELP